jgi:DNA-directed RNA polymerase specialized sigma24 family protein
LLGQAPFAYVDVAKAVVRERRSERLKFVDPLDVLDEPDSNATTEEDALRQIQDAEALADAARHLTDKEFAAIRLRYTAGYSRAEAAAVIFGDPEKKKQVDGLVERGKRKLAQAWSERRPSPRGSERTNLRGCGHEREGER